MSSTLYPVSFTIFDETSRIPLNNVALTIFNEDLSSIIVPALSTDTLGYCTTALPSGDYKVLFFLSGYTFTNPLAIHVVDNIQNLSIAGSASDPEPSTVKTCKLYGYIKDLNLNPIAGSVITIKLTPTPQTYKNITLSRQFIKLLTDENGYFEISVIGGLNVAVHIPDCNFSISGKLPYSGSIDVNSLNNQF